MRKRDDEGRNKDSIFVGVVVAEVNNLGTIPCCSLLLGICLRCGPRNACNPMFTWRLEWQFINEICFGEGKIFYR